MRELTIIQHKVGEDKQDSIWYDGNLSSIEEGDWTGLLSVVGDIRIEIKGEKFVFKNGSHANFIQDISEYVKNDADIYNLIKQELIDFDNSNWFEVEFENKVTREVISDVLDVESYDGAITAFKEYFEYLLEQKNG